MPDNSQFKQGLKGLCNRLNDDIIYAYEVLKRENFHWAFQHKDTYYGSDGEKDDGCFKEFSVEKGRFTFKFRTTYYQDAYNARSEAIEYFKKNGNSRNKVRELYDRILFNFEEEKNVRKQKLWIIKAGNFASIDDFAVHCSDNIDKKEKYVKGLLKILSNMPSEIMQAHSEYQKILSEKNEYKTAIEREENQKNRTFLGELEDNMNAFNKYVDYVQLVKDNPRFFFERFNKLPEEEKVPIVQKLLKDDDFLAYKEITDMFSKFYAPLIAEVGRKNIKPKRGR